MKKKKKPATDLYAYCLKKYGGKNAGKLLFNENQKISLSIHVFVVGTVAPSTVYGKATSITLLLSSQKKKFFILS